MMTLLVLLLLVYNAWLVSRLLKNRPHLDEDSKDAMITDKEEADEIVGKSHFKMKTKTPQVSAGVPQASNSVENEGVKEMNATFADETDNAASKRIPDDRLDEVFTHLVTSELQMDGDDEIDDDLPASGFASGASFDEIGEAVKIAGSEALPEEGRKRAGQVFNELEGCELFHRLTESSSSRAVKIKELMDFFLAGSSVKAEKAKEEEIQLQNKSGDSSEINQFDIRDFV